MDTKQTIAVLGSGSWGTAVAQVLSDNGHTVYLYGRNAAVVDETNRKHTHSKFFDDIALNPDLTAVHEIEIVKECKIIVLAVPTIAVESICQQIDPYLQDQCILVNLSKGFHPETNQRMSEVIRQSVSKNHLSSVVSLIGPSHAEEVVIRQLTTLAAVSLSSEDAKTIQRLFSNPYFRVYTGTDEVGSEIGAALKNVMAIASGILAGLGYRDNTRAALITRGLQEMIRFGMFFKGQPNTFVGLTGIGDLIVTCSSIHSRNYQAGYQIGLDNSVIPFLEQNKKTVEGVRTAMIVHKIAKENHIDMPICEEVYQILYQKKEPATCAVDLMCRDLKEEFTWPNM